MIASIFFHRPERIPGLSARMTSRGDGKMHSYTIGADISKDQSWLFIGSPGINHARAEREAGLLAQFGCLLFETGAQLFEAAVIT